MCEACAFAVWCVICGMLLSYAHGDPMGSARVMQGLGNGKCMPGHHLAVFE